MYSVSSGLVADDSINCQNAFEIGSKLMYAINGKTFESISFKRENKVLPLAAMSNTVKSYSTKVCINPSLLFQRLIVSKNLKTDLRDLTSYEMSPHPFI